MSVKIRLSKTGKTHRISYRIMAQDTRTKRDGKFLENLGYYNPYGGENQLQVKNDRIDWWVSRGAKPTAAVLNLLNKGKLVKKPKKVKVEESKDVAPTQEQPKAQAEAAESAGENPKDEIVKEKPQEADTKSQEPENPKT